MLPQRVYHGIPMQYGEDTNATDAYWTLGDYLVGFMVLVGAFYAGKQFQQKVKLFARR
jgi:hypothetical protein